MKPQLYTPIFHQSDVARQIASEQEATMEGVIRYQRMRAEAEKRGDFAALKPVERVMVGWLRELIPIIRAEQRLIKDLQHAKGRQIYGPIIARLTPERVAVAALSELMNKLLTNESAAVVGACMTVGNAVIAEMDMQMIRKDRALIRGLDKYCRSYRWPRVRWWAKRTLEDPVTARAVSIATGHFLIWSIISISAVEHNGKLIQAITHTRKNHTNAKLALHPAIYDIIEDGHEIRRYLRPRYAPMLIPPLKWSKETEGGYAKVRTPLVSGPSPAQKQAIDEADLDTIYEHLHAVNATAWRIDPTILPLAMKLYDQGGGMLGIPRRDPIPLPEPLGDRDWNDDKKRKEWKIAAHKVHKANTALKADRMNFIKTIDQARKFAGESAIYFPHQMDFRGRCYPIPLHLTHQGDDLQRAMLTFAHPRPMTDRGWWWLRVHAANCAGIDKVSYADRVAWTDRHMDAIAKTAEDIRQGGDGGEWWMEQDKPWQFLAACLALTDKKAAEHLPIQVDGSCNGSQHYAAIGRDWDAAATVNMIPRDMPADIYSDVAAKVAERVAKDAAAGIPEAQILDGHITRNIVKRPVMTSVYGVTAVGARNQVYELLDFLKTEDLERYRCSKYLANTTLKGIREVLPMASEIMDWLRQCAREVCKQGSLVRWTTPLGFPVVQHYVQASSYQVRCLGATINIWNPTLDSPPATAKQTNGMPPNWIHSIDATHMMMTAKRCHDQHITFAGVHDSYWTHAADVDQLQTITRETFVELHSEPLMDNLRAELMKWNPKADIPKPPATGELDINCVKESEYFFS